MSKSPTEIQRAWRARQDPLWLAVYTRLYHFGLTLDEYQAMLESQNESCAVCKCVLVLSGRGNDSLTVDHCHKTDRVRALLCSACNRVLGMAKESPSRLRACASYIQRQHMTNLQIALNAALTAHDRAYQQLRGLMNSLAAADMNTVRLNLLDALKETALLKELDA